MQQRANLIAVSTVSVPLLQKKTRERPSEVWLRQFLGDQAAEQAAIHPDQIGHVPVDQLLERSPGPSG